ncbi:MAG: mannose-1-phosphate guanylyltransferase [Candidatus Omnitrophota bacterium]
MKHVYALIMAGGRGQRIWPASRLKNPKHLLSLWGKKTMLQRTIERLSPMVNIGDTFVVTNRTHKNGVREQIPRLAKENLILEPFTKNTAACIGLAALWMLKRDPEAVMVVLPSDHIIKEKRKFHTVLSHAVSLAKSNGSLVTVGIVPRFPATGFGYIKLGRPSGSSGGIRVFKVHKFMEKPNTNTAEYLIRSEKYLWNSGIFIWPAKSILLAIRRHMPKLYMSLLRINKALGTRRYAKVLKREYAALKDISIDKGILERSPDIFTVSSDLKWDDVGSWSSLDYLGFCDKKRNLSIGEQFSIDTKDSILITDKGRLLATIGLSGFIVVQSEDATLICAKERAQEVKELVKRLRASRKFKKYT